MAALSESLIWARFLRFLPMDLSDFSAWDVVSLSSQRIKGIWAAVSSFSAKLRVSVDIGLSWPWLSPLATPVLHSCLLLQERMMKRSMLSSTATMVWWKGAWPRLSTMRRTSRSSSSPHGRGHHIGMFHPPTASVKDIMDEVVDLTGIGEGGFTLCGVTTGYTWKNDTQVGDLDKDCYTAYIVLKGLSGGTKGTKVIKTVLKGQCSWFVLRRCLGQEHLWKHHQPVAETHHLEDGRCQGSLHPLFLLRAYKRWRHIWQSTRQQPMSRHKGLSHSSLPSRIWTRWWARLVPQPRGQGTSSMTTSRVSVLTRKEKSAFLWLPSSFKVALLSRRSRRAIQPHLLLCHMLMFICVAEREQCHS